MAALGVTPQTIFDYLARGVLSGRQITKGQPWQIDLSVTVTPHEAVINIEDNGPGIAAAERTRVFDAFYRPEGMTQPGSGLGLSIVKACVTRLGGDIRLLPARQFPSGVLARIVLPLCSVR